MYKKLTFKELKQLKSGFFSNLKGIIERQRCKSLKEYLSLVGKKGDSVYHMYRQDYTRRTVFDPENNQVTFFDEREKIELVADKQIVSKLQSIVSDPRKIKAQSKKSESIEETLQKAFDNGELSDIQGKGYIVYDIETSYATNNLKGIQFYMGYAYIVQNGKGSYKYLDDSNMKKFVDFLLDFDGYIIGYNSIAFDNPVSLYHVMKDDFDQEEYDDKLLQLRNKSLDLFLFVRNTTGKRMGLNKLSRALVGLGKTLESGKEGENLWNLYLEGDKKALSTLKKYCKNDVKMTFLSLWYILYYKKLSLEGDDVSYTMEEFLTNSIKERKSDQEMNTSNKSDSLF